MNNELLSCVADSQLRSLEVQMEHANRQLKEKCSCGGMKRGISTASLRSNAALETPQINRKMPGVTTTVTKNKKETTFDVVPSKKVEHTCTFKMCVCF